MSLVYSPVPESSPLQVTSAVKERVLLEEHPHIEETSSLDKASPVAGSLATEVDSPTDEYFPVSEEPLGAESSSTTEEFQIAQSTIEQSPGSEASSDAGYSSVARQFPRIKYHQIARMSPIEEESFVSERSPLAESSPFVGRSPFVRTPSRQPQPTGFANVDALAKLGAFPQTVEKAPSECDSSAEASRIASANLLAVSSASVMGHLQHRHELILLILGKARR